MDCLIDAQVQNPIIVAILPGILALDRSVNRVVSWMLTIVHLSRTGSKRPFRADPII